MTLIYNPNQLKLLSNNQRRQPAPTTYRFNTEQIRPSDIDFITEKIYEELAALDAASSGGGTGNIVYVNSSSGNDGTGARGDSTLPFSTLGAARDAAIAGDTIQVALGTYNTNNANLGKDLVNWHFEFGSTVQAETTDTIWKDTANGYNVTGSADFSNGGLQSPYLIFLNQPNSKVNIKCRSIRGQYTTAVAWIVNSGLGKSIEADVEIRNLETGNNGRLFYLQGSGAGDINIKSPLLENNVQSLVQTGTTGEQGSSLSCSG